MTSVEAAAPTISADDLLAMPDGENYELLDGMLEEKCVSVDSSWIGGKVYGRIDAFVTERGLGFVYPPDIQLHIWPDRPRLVRKADAVFVGREHFPDDRPRGGFLEVAPDLVVEVVSKNNDADDVELKSREYLAAGVRLVWVVFPAARTAHVYRADGSASVHPEGEALDGEDVLPGFTLPLASVLPPRDGPRDP